MNKTLKIKKVNSSNPEYKKSNNYNRNLTTAEFNSWHSLSLYCTAENWGWSMGMQHNFIETLEATSIYKQGNGSSLNIKTPFFPLEPKWQKRTEKGNKLPRVGPAVAGAFFIQKITYEIFQVYRNIITHGLCKSMIGFTVKLCVSDFKWFNISKYQSRHYFDLRDRKNTTDEEQKKREDMGELGQMHSWILNFQCGAS